MNTYCAWCLEENNETPKEDDSHGICNDHAEQILTEYHWNRLQNTPSYLEQNAAEFAQEGE
jgi:hypothetical protein